MPVVAVAAAADTSARRASMLLKHALSAIGHFLSFFCSYGLQSGLHACWQR